MKSVRVLTLIVITLMIFSFGITAQESDQVKENSNETIHWLGYEEGWQKAKAENKHMFVNFTATWCGWCKKLDATTFQDERIYNSINNDFIPVKVWDHDTTTLDIDGYKIKTRDLIKREFRVTGYPALWFVSPQGVRIGPAGGYVDADRMYQFLDIVKNYRYDSTRNEQGELINPTE